MNGPCFFYKFISITTVTYANSMVFAARTTVASEMISRELIKVFFASFAKNSQLVCVTAMICLIVPVLIAVNRYGFFNKIGSCKSFHDKQLFKQKEKPYPA